MKKFLCIALTAAAMAFATNDIAVEAKTIERGDVDLNGSVNLSDAQTTLKAALNIVKLNENEEMVADINNDGDVTLSDAQMTLKHALNIVGDCGSVEIGTEEATGEAVETEKPVVTEPAVSEEPKESDNPVESDEPVSNNVVSCDGKYTLSDESQAIWEDLKSHCDIDLKHNGMTEEEVYRNSDISRFNAKQMEVLDILASNYIEYQGYNGRNWTINTLDVVISYFNDVIDNQEKYKWDEESKEKLDENNLRLAKEGRWLTAVSIDGKYMLSDESQTIWESLRDRYIHDVDDYYSLDVYRKTNISRLNAKQMESLDIAIPKIGGMNIGLDSMIYNLNDMIDRTEKNKWSDEEKAILDEINLMRAKAGVWLLNTRFSNGHGKVGEINDEVIDTLSKRAVGFAKSSVDGVYYCIAGESSKSTSYIFTAYNCTSEEFLETITNTSELKALLIGDRYISAEISYVPSISEGYYDSWQIVLSNN